MRTLFFLSYFLLGSLTCTCFGQQSCSYMIHVDGISGQDQISCGSESSPCASINYGLDRAVSEGIRNIRVRSSAVYNETVVLREGVSIWGGFDTDWARTDTTRIKGNIYSPDGQYISVYASGLDSVIILSDLVLIGSNTDSSGMSSYALYISDCSDIHIQRSAIYAGNAANGDTGQSGTNATQTAVNGVPGMNGAQFTASCDIQRQSGGSGGNGSGSTGDGGGGGAGGQMDTDCDIFNNCSPCNATSGIPGANANTYSASSYGAGGTAGTPCQPGGNGMNGRTIHGVGAPGAQTNSQLVLGYYSATTAPSGTLGQDGTGGGGGGGAGGCDAGTDSRGPGGGGGGSGGFRAPTAGTGGQSGGNSCGVFILNSQLSIKDCSILRGKGGAGGDGGDGGEGTSGGTGGQGGSATSNTGAGGRGGNGGHGGHSGAGGGGAGGWSYGIYGFNSVLNQNNITISGGVAGNAGAGGIGAVSSCNGADGVNGGLTDIAGNNLSQNTQSFDIITDPCMEVTISSISGNSFCVEDSAWVAFNAVGLFDQSNVFSLELSGQNGSFNSPQTIAQLAENNSDTFRFIVGSSIMAGDQYRLRVTSSWMSVVSEDNGNDLTFFPEIDTSTSHTGNQLEANIQGASYQWIDCNDLQNTLANSNSRTYTAVQSGSYAVIITEGSCSDTSGCIAVPSTMGIVDARASMIIYPNPAEGTIHISMDNPIDGELIITDLQGKAVHTNVLYGRKEHTIKLELAPGYYLMHFRSSLESFSSRLLVK